MVCHVTKKKIFLAVLILAVLTIFIISSFFKTPLMRKSFLTEFVPKSKKEVLRPLADLQQNSTNFLKKQEKQDLKELSVFEESVGREDGDYKFEMHLFHGDAAENLTGTGQDGKKNPIGNGGDSGVVFDKPKFDYLVEKADPRAEKMFQRVLMKLTPQLRKLFLQVSKQFEAKYGKPLNKEPVRKKWAFIIHFMDKLGYHQRLPSVINIGVKKSGTNAFGFFINQHPDISHSIGNEVHYFDWNYDKGIEYYRSRMQFSSKDQLVFEKTPRYFVTNSTPLNIKRDLQQPVKFILCVKNPISRLVSDYRHESELKLHKVWREKGKSKFGRTEDSEGKRLEGMILDHKGNINGSNELILTSNYLYHMKNWLKYYPLDQFYFVDSDRLANDAYSVMIEIEHFLGLKSYFKKSMFFYDKARGGSCMTNSDRPCPAKSTPGILPKAKLSPEITEKLEAYYRPLMKEFMELVGQKFLWATF